MTHKEAFARYANANIGKEKTTAEIDKEAERILGRTPTMCASDFAEPEASDPRSKLPVLFKRIRKGVYLVLGENKKIIALQAESGRGKTTTLKALIREIAKRYPTATIEIIQRRLDIFKIIPADFDDYMSSGVDKVVVFNLENGVKIGVITYGDPSTANDPRPALKEYLKGLINNFACNIIFCGCRPERNVTVDWIKSYKQDGYDIDFEPQEDAGKNADMQNERDIRIALKLLSKV